MFSFFKRKKKPETPETAPEQNAQPVETAESAPAITPPEHTHTEPGHIPVTVAEFEQPQPLSEHARETVAADAATHPVSRFAHDIAHPEAPAAATLAPDAPETAPEVAERPSEAEAAPQRTRSRKKAEARTTPAAQKTPQKANQAESRQPASLAGNPFGDDVPAFLRRPVVLAG